jgi:hypothetical protein
MKKEAKWAFEMWDEHGNGEFEVVANKDEAVKRAQSYFEHLTAQEVKKAIEADGTFCWAAKYNMTFDEGMGQWVIDDNDPDPVEETRNWFDAN